MGLNCVKLLFAKTNRIPSQPHMQLTSRQVVTQFAHMLQEELFPLLQSSVGPLNGQMQLLASVISLAPLERMLCARRAATGRPAKDPAAGLLQNRSLRQQNYGCRRPHVSVPSFEPPR